MGFIIALLIIWNVYLTLWCSSTERNVWVLWDKKQWKNDA